MQKWTRWQDWAALLVGVYAFLSPIWTTTETKTTWTMVILGVITALVSLWSLARPEDRISEYTHIVMGVLFFISPWVLTFTAMTAMATTAWVLGVIAVVVGLLAVAATQGGIRHLPLMHH